MGVCNRQDGYFGPKQMEIGRLETSRPRWTMTHDGGRSKWPIATFLVQTGKIIAKEEGQEVLANWRWRHRSQSFLFCCLLSFLPRNNKNKLQSWISITICRWLTLPIVYIRWIICVWFDQSININSTIESPNQSNLCDWSKNKQKSPWICIVSSGTRRTKDKETTSGHLASRDSIKFNQENFYTIPNKRNPR